jgi:hypothetical protein
MTIAKPSAMELANTAEIRENIFCGFDTVDEHSPETLIS